MATNANSDEPEITVASTSDSQEAIDAAAGVEKEEEEKPEAAEQEETKKEGEESSESSEDEKKEESKEDKTASESETEDEDEEAEEDSGTEKGTSKGPGKLRKRVDKLTKRLRDTERELQAARDRVTKLEGGTEEESEEEESEEAATGPQFNKAKPKKSDFKDDEEGYLDALTDWKMEKKDFDRAVEAQNAKIRETYDNYNNAQEKFKASHDDYDDVAEGARQIPVAVQIAIIDSGNPELAYELAKDPDFCDKLCKMTDAQAVRELGKFEAALEARNKASASETEKKPKAKAAAAPSGAAPTKKAPSAATAPIKPVGGGSTKGTSTPLDKTEYQEYKRRRDAGER